MRRILRSKRTIALSLVLVIALTVVAYVVNIQRLNDARLARREDDLSRAEDLLSSLWPLPGLRSDLELEEKLLAVQQGDLREEKAIQAGASRGQSYKTLILEALAKGNLATFQWEMARNHAESILSQHPDDARALWLRGRALLEMQFEDRARQDFEDALKAEPNSFAIQLSLAELLHKMGYVQLAIDHYQTLQKLRPDDKRILLSLAHCYQEQSQCAKAVEVVERVLESQPDSVDALVERARLALRADKPVDAERWLRRAIELQPEHSEANITLRVALQAQDKSDLDFDRHLQDNDLRQAKLKTQMAQHSHEPEVLTNVGLWMMKTGVDNEVSGWLYSALKRDSDYKPAHEGLAQFFSKHGQNRRAAWHAKLAGMESPPVAKSFVSHASSRNMTGGEMSTTGISNEPTVVEASTAEVTRLCAACHAYPSPESMPRSAWRKEVKQGYDFLRKSKLAGDYPSFESVVAYYESHAPEKLPPIEQVVTADAPPVKFQIRGTGYMPRLPPSPGVTNAQLAPLFDKKQQALLLCETRQDALMVLKPYEAGPGGTIIPQVPSPCHATVCDLDLDGRDDILVASIGSFFPTDDKLGKVMWLKGKPGGQFDAVSLLEGVGRVTDIQAADFNGDKQLDLVVAVFGWRSTGEILYLENQTTEWSQPKFVPHVVDSRHGAVHVPIADINRDGRPDFVGLVSQEHEAVVAYVNQGDDSFEKVTLFEAPHPSYGCSGIELVDLDGDRDTDVLLSNGDILDPPYILKPYHGIQWLENTGALQFKHHPISAIYGAMRAAAADFDGDGDLDVAAVSFLPSMHFPEREKLRIPSVMLFEQTSGVQFKMHVIEVGTCDHFSCAAGDWDDDGRVDLAVTNFSWNGSQPMRDAATLWRNVGK